LLYNVNTNRPMMMLFSPNDSLLGVMNGVTSSDPE